MQGNLRDWPYQAWSGSPCRYALRSCFENGGVGEADEATVEGARIAAGKGYTAVYCDVPPLATAGAVEEVGPRHETTVGSHIASLGLRTRDRRKVLMHADASVLDAWAVERLSVTETSDYPDVTAQNTRSGGSSSVSAGAATSTVDRY